MKESVKLYNLMHEEYSLLKDGMYGMEKGLTVLEKYAREAENNSIKLVKGDNYSKVLKIFRSELEGSTIYLRQLTAKVKQVRDTVYGDEPLNIEETKNLKSDTGEFLEQYNRCYSCVKSIRMITDNMRLNAMKELENPVFLNGKLAQDLQQVVAQSMYVGRLVDSVSVGVVKSFKEGSLHQIIEADALLDNDIKMANTKKRGR